MKVKSCFTRDNWFKTTIVYGLFCARVFVEALGRVNVEVNQGSTGKIWSRMKSFDRPINVVFAATACP